MYIIRDRYLMQWLYLSGGGIMCFGEVSVGVGGSSDDDRPIRM